MIDDLSTGRLDNLRTVESHPQLRVITDKVSTCKELPEIVAGAESIYHLAAAVGVELVMKSQIHTIETNLHETEVILEVASRFKVPVLLTSTSEVYGKSQKDVFSEEDDLVIGPPHLSRWSYACSKLMDEFLALAYAREKGLPVLIARLFNTVGPRQTGRYGMVLPRFIEAARKGESLKVFGDGKQTRCFCYVKDTVEALVRLQNCAGAKGGIFNVGRDSEISIVQLAQLVLQILGSRSSIEYVPYDKAYLAGFEDMRRRRPAIQKLANTIGFHPQTSIEEIIRLTS
ncbi:MAG: NAD-dependent epimerase/dehydratase [Verrucomicrobiales bacterium]|nr:NAD-dependent epimerase/dehydratase [Verrucomicrobiales bacterium]